MKCKLDNSVIPFIDDNGNVPHPLDFCYSTNSISSIISEYYVYYNSPAGFVCPKCFNPFLLNMDYHIQIENINANNILDSVLVEHDFSLRCPKCKHEFHVKYHLDPAITPHIALLNRKGYITDFSCQGHDDRTYNIKGYNSRVTNYAYIKFEKSINSILKEHPLIKPWKKEPYNTIRSKNTNLAENMMTLWEWVNSLPCISKK